MIQGWWTRFSVMAVLLLLALFSVSPSLFSLKEDGAFPFKKKINLGLDLQGGLYMVLGIDFNKVYRDEVTNYIRKATNNLKEANLSISLGSMDTSNEEDPKQVIKVENSSDISAVKEKMKELFNYPLRLADENGNELIYGLGRDFKKEIENSAVDKSIEVIRNRIDEFGVTEPEIVSQGSDRIVVQLPGVKDIDRAKELIGKTAKLEFKFVNDTINEAQLTEWMTKIKEAGIEYKKGERFSDYVKKINNQLKTELPENHELAFSKVVSKTTNEITDMQPYLLEAMASLTGDELQEAFVTIDQQENRPEVSISFKPNGAKIFEEMTGKNVGRRMAIVLDGNVYSAPVIQTRIAGGTARITLGFGDYNKILTEARDLALVLRAGALPVELVFEEQRVVGPSLGADAIKTSEMAGLIASILVFIFVILYYKSAGVIATMTIMANVIFVLASLVALGATLTLPGIAGIALTVGMAVDGNIIIYERIREELRLGASPKEAVSTGFNKAFWTILDANLTTAVAGIALLNFGTGPVRGFAVTLLIGIMTTVYTSYFMSRVIFDWYLSKNKNLKTLSI